MHVPVNGTIVLNTLDPFRLIVFLNLQPDLLPLNVTLDPENRPLPTLMAIYELPPPNTRVNILKKEID